MKKITVAVVIDDEKGMLIFGKRQSRDRVMIEEFVNSFKDKEICISNFSELIFEPHKNVKVYENPLEECESGAVCFIENIDITPYLGSIDTLIVYHWNRLYPSDVKFNIDVNAEGYTLDSVIEFSGSSHDKITKEIYKK